MKLNSFWLMGPTLSQWIYAPQGLYAPPKWQTTIFRFLQVKFYFILPDRKRRGLFPLNKCFKDFNSISCSKDARLILSNIKMLYLHTICIDTVYTTPLLHTSHRTSMVQCVLVLIAQELLRWCYLMALTPLCCQQGGLMCPLLTSTVKTNEHITE